jgi:hypothetical protein
MYRIQKGGDYEILESTCNEMEKMVGLQIQEKQYEVLCHGN